MIAAFIQQNIFLVMFAAASGGMLLWSLVRGGASDGLSLNDATLKINREDAVVIDVRDSSEWSAGHIPHARHITLGQLESRLSEIEKFRQHPLIVVCASGVRSLNACQILKKAGFEQVFNLAGGMTAWREANLPVTSK